MPARPPFTKAFPADEGLERLVEAFARGDHRYVRDEAPKLAEHDDPEVRAAAAELLRRTRPDPIAYVLLGTTAALLVFLTLWAMHQSRVNQSEPQPPQNVKPRLANSVGSLARPLPSVTPAK